MTIQSYDDLTAAIAAWLARNNDPTDPVIAQIPTFIQLCESHLNDHLRADSNQQRSWAFINEQVEGLPSDYLEMVQASIFTPNDRSYPMTQKSVREVRRCYTAPGQPYTYAIAGKQIIFGPYVTYDKDADEADMLKLELVYYASVLPLGAVNSSNSVLLASPDLYLYGSLVFAQDFLMADQFGRAKQLFDEALNSANEAGQNALYGTMACDPPDQMIV